MLEGIDFIYLSKQDKLDILFIQRIIMHMKNMKAQLMNHRSSSSDCKYIIPFKLYLIRGDLYELWYW